MPSRTGNSSFGARLAAMAFAAIVSACGGGGGGGGVGGVGGDGGGGAPAPVFFPGQIDSSFGKGGLFDTRDALGGVTANGASLSVDGAGRLLVGGSVYGRECCREVPLFARISPGGSLDPTFGSGGFIPASSQVLPRTFLAMAFPVAGGKTVLVHDRGVICGFDELGCISGPLEVVLRRVGPDGSPDLSYEESVLERMYERQVIAQPDGAVLISGYVEHKQYEWGRIGLRRVGANGRLDAAFAQNSDAVLACPELPWDRGAGGQDIRIARLADGRILVARWDGLDWVHVADRPPRKTCITRLNPDGTLDTSYGNGGRVYVNDGGGAQGLVQNVVEVLPLPTGGVALVMHRQSGDNYGPRFGAILWLAPNGAVDTARGEQGLATLGTHLGYIASAALDSDGRFLMAGDLAGDAYLRGYHGRESRIVRLDAAGRPDSGFGENRDGVVPLKFADRRLSPRAVTIAPDGSIHIIGAATYDIEATSFWHLGVTRLFGGTR